MKTKLSAVLGALAAIAPLHPGQAISAPIAVAVVPQGPSPEEIRERLLDGNWDRSGLPADKIAALKAKADERMAKLIGSRIRTADGKTGKVMSFRFYRYLAAQPYLLVHFTNGAKDFLRERDFELVTH